MNIPAMARGWSGMAFRQDGKLAGGPVTCRDERQTNLHELLRDLGSPGLCIVLGAGASHGLVPITRQAFAERAREILAAQGPLPIFPRDVRDRRPATAEVAYVRPLVAESPSGFVDRLVEARIGAGCASFLFSQNVTLSQPVPRALTRVYDVFEHNRGTVISYNYDRITDGVRGFEVLTPHGQVCALLINPTTALMARRMAIAFNWRIPNDLHLPVPEDESVRVRRDYLRMLEVWRRCSAVVFVGYGFGQGADALSFEDFGENLNTTARVHVLCPHNDNRDLCRQVGSALKGRGPRFRVFGHPFRWNAFAGALVELLDSMRANHVSWAFGHETEIALRHDRL